MRITSPPATGFAITFINSARRNSFRSKGSFSGHKSATGMGPGKASRMDTSAVVTPSSRIALSSMRTWATPPSRNRAAASAGDPAKTTRA